MQTHNLFLPEKVVLSMTDEAVDTCLNVPLASSAFDAVLPPGVRQITPVGRVKLQPSEVCPKNFIIFDQTDRQRRIMFYPEMTYEFNGSTSFNVHATCTQDSEKKKVRQMEGRSSSSPFEEDSNDIDALLSLEFNEPENKDNDNDEEVSTARTDANNGNTSDTCCSSHCSKSRKRLSSSSVEKSSGTTRGYCNNERKHQEIKRMMSILRRIVPGGSNHMDTAAVLDEAVKYIKSFKVGVEQFGTSP